MAQLAVRHLLVALFALAACSSGRGPVTPRVPNASAQLGTSQAVLLPSRAAEDTSPTRPATHEVEQAPAAADGGTPRAAARAASPSGSEATADVAQSDRALALGPWLRAHGFAADAPLLVANGDRVCERSYRIADPPEDAIQCQVFRDVLGRIEPSYSCSDESCLHIGTSSTRVYVVRDGKLQIVLEVLTSASLDDTGGSTEYVRSFLTLAEDRLSIAVRTEQRCAEARASARDDGRRWHIAGGSHAVKLVCADQGDYVWRQGVFRR